jgi:electron transfer flavoprotein beta subunit
MRIIVPIKQILDPGGITFRRDKERMFVNREEYIIGPGSRAAIEAALLVRDAAQPTSEREEFPHITTLSVGPARADDALREALALGCNSAYLLSDSLFQSADVAATTRILAAAVDKLGGAELIIVGRESGDTGAGQIGPRLAGALGYTQVTDVCALIAGEGQIKATRRWHDAYAAVEATFPVVVSVAPEAFPGRYPHGARIINAYQQWEVTVWGASDLELGEAALEPMLVPRGESYPPPVEVGEVFRGEADTIAQEAIMTLWQQRLVS